MRKPFWATALLALLTWVGASPGHGQTASNYAVDLQPGYNPIANHLDRGNNSIQAVLPGMPPGAEFYKYDPVGRRFFRPAVFIVGTGWTSTEPAEASLLRPGEAGFLRVNATFPLTFQGAPHPFQPRVDLRPGWNLVGCQRVAPCTYFEALGFEALPGDAIYIYDQATQVSPTNYPVGAQVAYNFSATDGRLGPMIPVGRAAFVFLTDPPHIARQPESQVVRPGETVVLRTDVVGLEPLSFRWQRDGMDLGAPAGNVLTLTSVRETDSGDYQCVVFNVAGVATTAVARILVLVPPTIISGPSNAVRFPGESVEFRVVAEGTPPLSFRWTKDGALLTGAVATGPNLILNNVQVRDRGVYACIVGNEAGTVQAGPAFLEVLQAPVVVAAPPDRTVQFGGPLMLEVMAEGTPPLQFFWRRNGVLIPGATNNILFIPDAQLADAGAYTVTVQNRLGAVNSPEAIVAFPLGPLQFSDSFANAQVITGAPVGVAAGQNFNATNELGEPRHFDKVGGRSVWLRWLAPQTGIVTFHTRGSTFDTLLAAYLGSTLAGLQEQASDDDSGGSLTSEIRFNATQGQIYSIVIDGFYGEMGQIALSWTLRETVDRMPVILVQPRHQIGPLSNDYTFVVQVQGPASSFQYQWFFNDAPIAGALGPAYTVRNAQPTAAGVYHVRISQREMVESRRVLLQFAVFDPAFTVVTNFFRDKLGDAIGLVGATGTPAPAPGAPAAPPAAPITLLSGYVGSQIFNTYGSGSQPGEPVHCGVVGGASQWFVYTPASSGILHVDTEGSDYDTILAIYRGPGTSFTTLIPVACDNDSGTGLTSKLSFSASAGTNYMVVVDGVGGATGNLTLNYHLLIPILLSRPRLSGSNFRFSVNATPAWPFTVQRTTNFINWTTVMTTNSTASVVTVTDATGVTPGKRFNYRVRQTP